MSKRQNRPNEREPMESYREDSLGQAPYAPEALAQARRAHRRRRSGALFKSLILLSALSIGIVVAQKVVFRLETVYVIGNEQKTPQQVVTAAGLSRGRNMLAIEEADVAAALAKDYTIIFEGMQKEYPNTLYLYISERRVAAAMQCRGDLYTLDEDGMVMSLEGSAAAPSGIPMVTGFDVSNVYVGRILSVKESGQLEAYCRIMEELRLQLYADQVSEINLRDPENLYMVTVEGISVRLGDQSYMRAKIGSVRTCMGRLRQLGDISGALDVTIPETPKFMPDK